MEKISRIVIADDFPMFLQGLSLLLEKQPGFEIVGEASNGQQLTAIAKKLQPDVVITDIEMPIMTGIEATREIKSCFPSIGIIALTMFGDDQFVLDMLEAGASGYLLKNGLKEELFDAITVVIAGGNYYSNSTSMRLSKMIAASKARSGNTIGAASFSPKELEIIQLICQQYASKEIADKTMLTHRTVEKYRDRIMEKTGSRNMAGIVVFAIRHGIYKP
jgi:DNA-binding NarL/FixJ family response regulator